MATTNIQVDLLEENSPVLAFLYNTFSGQQSGNPAGYSLTLGSQDLLYTFPVVESCSGIYRLIAQNGDGVAVGQGYVWIEADDTNTYITSSDYQILKSREEIISKINTVSVGNGTGLTNIPWNSAWDAEVQSECTDALNAYDPPTNAEMIARTLDNSLYALETSVDGLNNISSTDVSNSVLSSMSGYGVSKTSEVTQRTLPSGQYLQSSSIPTISGIRSDLDNNSTFASRIGKMPRASGTFADGESYDKSLDGFSNFISETIRKS